MARLGRWVALVACVGSLGSAGCGGAHKSDADRSSSSEVAPYFTTIDVGHTLTTTLGEGAALFVEYESGGTWHLWTSCDTKATGADCFFRAYVYPRGGIVSLAALDFEAGDRIDETGDGSFTFISQTRLDSDGMTLVSKPGALLDLELELDGFADASYLVWYGNGAVHEGAPRSPVVFQPDAP